MRRCVAKAILLLPVLAACIAVAQEKTQIRDPAEYNAYVQAINLQDPQQKAAALKEFLARYPNSAVREDALAQLKNAGGGAVGAPVVHHVYVEPWETLVRDTVRVNAGQTLQYNFALPAGAQLITQFQVQGGLNNQIQVFLLDFVNYQLYSAHRPFKYYSGTSGTVRGVGQYQFRVPQAGVYYIVLDNGNAWFVPRNVTLHVDAILPQSTAQSEQLRAGLENMYLSLRKAFVFPDFQTSVRHCAVGNPCRSANLANACSNPNITICAELVEELTSKGMGEAILFVHLHELGHTLMKEWGLPLWDNEDAADEFATAFLLIAKRQDLALQAAQYWASKETTDRDAITKIWMDDRHSLSPQRARNIVRWISDSNEIVPRWKRVFIPNMRTDVLQSALRDLTEPELEKDFIRSELKRRGGSTMPEQTQLLCPRGQDLVGGSCAPMCWEIGCDVPVPCGSRVSTGVSIVEPRSACSKYERTLAANPQGCPLGSYRKNAPGKGCYSCVVNANPRMCFEYEDGFFSKEIQTKCGTGRWTSCAPTD